jgi:hypothetical protein
MPTREELLAERERRRRAREAGMPASPAQPQAQGLTLQQLQAEQARRKQASRMPWGDDGASFDGLYTPPKSVAPPAPRPVKGPPAALSGWRPDQLASAQRGAQPGASAADRLNAQTRNVALAQAFSDIKPAGSDPAWKGPEAVDPQLDRIRKEKLLTDELARSGTQLYSGDVQNLLDMGDPAIERIVSRDQLPSADNRPFMSDADFNRLTPERQQQEADRMARVSAFDQTRRQDVDAARNLAQGNIRFGDAWTANPAISVREQAIKQRQERDAAELREASRGYGALMDMAVTQDDRGLLQTGTSVDRDIGKGITAAPINIANAASMALEATANFPIDAYNHFRGQDVIPRIDTYKIPLPQELESGTGALTQGLAQFLFARGAIGKMAPGGGLGAQFGKDAAAVGLGFDGSTGRVADMLDLSAIPEGPLRDYAAFLKTQPEDSQFVGRLKNALEDLTLSGPFLAPQAAVRGAQAVNRAINPSLTPTNAGGARVRPQPSAPPPRNPREAYNAMSEEQRRAIVQGLQDAGMSADEIVASIRAGRFSPPPRPEPGPSPAGRQEEPQPVEEPVPEPEMPRGGAASDPASARAAPAPFSAAPEPLPPRRGFISRNADTIFGGGAGAYLGGVGEANAADENETDPEGNPAVGAGVGGAIGMAIPRIGRRFAGQVARTVGRPFNPRGYDERIVAGAIRRDLRNVGITNADEAAAAMAMRFGDKPSTIADLTQEGINKAAGLSRLPGETPGKARIRYEELGDAQKGRLERDIASANPNLNPGTITGNIDEMIQAAREQAAPAYNALRANYPELDSPRLRVLLDMDVMRPHVEAANAYATTVRQTTGRQLTDFEIMDLIKRNMDAAEQKLIARPGASMDDLQIRQIEEARSAFVRELDQLMPEYAAARKAGGEAPIMKADFEKGQRLLEGRYILEDVTRIVTGITDRPLTALQAGVIRSMVAKAQNTRGAVQALSSSSANKKLAAVFGQEAADAMQARFKADAAIMQNAGRINPNVGSVTGQALMGGGGFAADAVAAIRALRNPTEAGLSWLSKAGAYSEAQRDLMGQMLLEGATPENLARIFPPRGRRGGPPRPSRRGPPPRRSGGPSAGPGTSGGPPPSSASGGATASAADDFVDTAGMADDVAAPQARDVGDIPFPAQGAPEVPEWTGPRPKKPQSLLAWIRSQGGIKDTNYMTGDLKAIMGRANAYPGLLNNKSGTALDLLARRAYSEGFDVDPEDANTLMRLIDEEFRGDPSYRIGAREEWDAYQDYLRQVDRYEADRAPDTMGFGGRSSPAGARAVQQAQSQGYAGRDIGEAQEWVRAREKGLDMSQEGRMARAQKMGFDVKTPLYHGTTKKIDEFEITKDGSLGPGVYFAKSPNLASEYARGQGANVMPVYVRGRIASEDEWSKIWEQESAKVADDVTSDVINARVTPILKKRGYAGIETDSEVVIFDPSNIRSVNAAFGPGASRSPNILSGMGRSPVATGTVAGGTAGAVAPYDSDGDGQISANERAASVMGGMISGGIGGAAASRLMPGMGRKGPPPAGPRMGPRTMGLGGARRQEAANIRNSVGARASSLIDDLPERAKGREMLEALEKKGVRLFKAEQDAFFRRFPAERQTTRTQIESFMDDVASGKTFDGQLPAGRPVPAIIDEVTNLKAAQSLAAERPFNTNRDLKVALDERFRARSRAARVDLSEDTKATREYIARVALADAIEAIRTNKNAIGWYDDKVTKAMSVMEEVHPELATDVNARFAFTVALAITSNGQKVGKNFELAEQAYKAFKGNGRMPTNIKAGEAQKAINDSLDLFNELLNRHGIDKLRDIITTKRTVKEIEELTGIKIAERADEEVFGAGIFGPKIGNGFLMNLNGEFGQLTIDRWFMRTWGRWTGKLIEKNKDMIIAKRDHLSGLINMMDPSDKREFEAIIGRRLSVSAIDDVAYAIRKASQDPALRDRMADIGVLGHNSRPIVDALLGAPPKGKQRLSLGDELRKNGNGLWKYLDGQIEQPSGPAQRRQIREVMTTALEMLKKDYPDLTMADLQALLWYPEKLLYDSAKVVDDARIAKGYVDEEAPDYLNAAIEHAEKLGISRARIDGAVAKGQSRIDARRRSGSVGSNAGRSGQGSGLETQPPTSQAPVDRIKGPPSQGAKGPRTTLSAFPGGGAGAQAATGAVAAAYGYAMPQDFNDDGAIDDTDRGMTAGLYGLGGLTAAGLARARNASGRGAVPDGATTRTFGGENAKTADKRLLGIAKQMEKAGGGRDQIWRETGWGRSRDGKWRFEIDDSKSGFRLDRMPEEGRTTSLGNVLEHEDAYAAYPTSRDIQVVEDPNTGRSGAFYPGADMISLRSRGFGAGGVKSTALHENQHAIQELEGFAAGGSPSSAYMSDELRPEWMRQVDRQLTPPTYEQFAANPTFAGVPKSEVRRQYNGMVKDIREARKDPYHPLSRAAQESAARDIYRRLAGEVEARNVQIRRNMTPYERRANPPWTTQDVPDDQQIVRMIGGPQESSLGPPKSSAMATQEPVQPPPVKGPPTASRLDDSSEIGQSERMLKLADVEKLIASAEGPLFIRWSNGPKFDMRAGAKSKDYQTGLLHDGLSAVELKRGWSRSYLARRLGEYNSPFVKSGKNFEGHIYEGKVVGKDSDGYPSIRPVRHVGTLDPDFSKALADRDVIQAAESLSAISSSRARLDALLGKSEITSDERVAVGVFERSIAREEEVLAKLPPDVVSLAKQMLESSAAPALKSGGGSLPPIASGPGGPPPPAQRLGKGPKGPPGSSSIGRMIGGGAIGGALGAMAGEAEADSSSEIEQQLQAEMAKIAQLNKEIEGLMADQNFFRTADNKELQRRLAREGFNLGPTGVDGILSLSSGRETLSGKAIREFKANIEERLNAANERLNKAEGQVKVLMERDALQRNRPNFFIEAAREYGPTMAGVLAGFGLKYMRGSAAKASVAGAKAASQKLNRLITPISKEEVTGMLNRADESRPANLNQLWQKGGAKKDELPFLQDSVGKWKPNPNARPADELFQDDNLWKQLTRYVKGKDLAWILGSGGEAAVMQPFIDKANKDLVEAERAWKDNPSDETYKRVEDAKNAVANYTLLQRLGMGVAGGRIIGSLGAAYAKPQPNIVAAATEQAALKQYIASTKPPPKPRGPRKPKAPPPVESQKVQGFGLQALLDYFKSGSRKSKSPPPPVP